MAESQPSILLVDDDADDLASVEKALRALACELVPVRDPHGVLPSVHRLRPAVVILDALLPGLSGFDLCKQIKSDPQLKGTQVLILTGVYLRQQYRQEALQQFKADAFLTKPFRPPELQRLVVQLLSKRTRTPAGGFLRRSGVTAAGEPRKRGFFDRIFRRDEEAEEVPAQIAPREDAPAKVAAATAAEEVASEAASAAKLEAEKAEAEKVEPEKVEPEEVEPEKVEPEKVEPEKVEPEKVEPEKVEPEKVEPEKVEPEKVEPEKVEPEVLARPAPPPQHEETPVAESPERIPAPDVATPASVTEDAPTGSTEEPLPPDETTPGEAFDEPSAAEELEARPPSAGRETVTWLEAASKTRGLKPEELPPPPPEPEPTESEAPIELPPPAAEEGYDESAFAETSAEPPPEPLAAEAPSEASRQEAPRPTQNRPRFRVGEVPVYDEDDFLTELKRELSKCKRVDRPLTLILIQVSDLGQIVELFGKNFREPVLWHVAEQAMASLREVDLVGMMSSKDLVAMTAFASDRYGGGRIVSRMRSSVKKTPFRVGEELPPIIPALQFGMATFPQDGSDVSGLMKRAESELSAD